MGKKAVNEFFYNILALFRKEVLILLQDKRNRFILVAPILVQTLVFGYVASYDLNRVEFAVLDADNSTASRRLVAQFDGSPNFVRVASLESPSQMAQLVDTRKMLLVVHIGQHFERELQSGNQAPVQIIVDGRNSNVAGIAAGYANALIAAFNGEWGGGEVSSMPVVSARAWFNPNLETRWNIISGMVVVLAVVQVTILAGQSVAREKEQGTFDQILVTPLGPMELLLGKALPPVVIGLVQSSLVLFVALKWFAIPFAGSYALLYAGLFVYNCAIVGIGLCISALTSTMQQAMLYCFTALMPMILLSGFATPIASMPEVLQMATLLNPARYGVEFAQRIYLEGAGLQAMMPLYTPLALMACVTLGTASRLFRTRL